MISEGFTNAEIERIMADLGRKIDEVKIDLRADIADVKSSVAEIKQSVVHSDVHRVEIKSLQDGVDRANERAETAETLAKWALGVLVALLGTVITIAILIANGGGTP